MSQSSKTIEHEEAIGMTLLKASLTVAVLTMAATAAQAQTLRVGTEGAYPPWNYTDPNGELGGFDVDLAKALCEETGMECEIVAQDWDGIIPALLQGRYDAIMAGMSINDERRERISFSNAYASEPGFFITGTGGDLAGKEDLDGLFAALEDATVGVQTATTHHTFMEQELPDVALRIYDTLDQAFLDLAAGRLDAVLADDAPIQVFLDSESGAGFERTGPGMTGLDFPVYGEGVGIGLRKDDAELRERLNAALYALYEKGTLQVLAEQHFGHDISMPQSKPGQ